MRTFRLLIGPLVAVSTYTRWVYLILGGAVFMPYIIGALVLVSLFAPAFRAEGADTVFPAGSVPGLVLAVALVAATGWLPGVYTMQSQLTRALLGGAITGDPIAAPTAWRSRARLGVWTAVHLLVGFAACMVTMIVLTQSAVLAAAPLPFIPTDTEGNRALLGVLAPMFLGGPWTPVAPLIAVLLLVALVLTVAATGGLLAMAAPYLLGASAADRIAAAQARADSLAERNRLARELHDSIGHALSAVALHAGTAARLFDSDPAFARQALEAIADQARTATGELDHVLGVLREERSSTAPGRDLTDLPALIEATRTIGIAVGARIDGDPALVPGVVSRETYRVCQEGLTNAARHAGKVPITVQVDIASEGLSVQITNPLDRPGRPGRAARRPGGGRGLRGMRERVRLLGGRLDAGEHDGQWRLDLRLTWGSAR